MLLANEGGWRRREVSLEKSDHEWQLQHSIELDSTRIARDRSVGD